MRLIDADALIKYCNEKWIPLNIDAVKAQPTIKPQRKKGKWIYNSPVTMKCNQCELVIKDWDWHRFNYCPNCGARMEDNDE